MLQKHGNRIALNAALSSDTWNTCDVSLIHYAAEHGIHEIGIVLDLSPSFYSEYGQENIVERLWQLVEEGFRYNIVVTGYWHQIFQLISGVNAVSVRGFKMCSAKGCQLSIEPNGSVFSCKGASGYYGHLIDDGDKLLKHESLISHAALAQHNPKACSGCQIEAFCSGFCLGPLEKKFGQVNAIESSACAVYKGITERLIENLQPGTIATFRLGTKEESARMPYNRYCRTRCFPASFYCWHYVF